LLRRYAAWRSPNWLTIPVLFVIVYLTALSVHEVAHLVILRIMGGEGQLIISPWDFYFVQFRTYGLHLVIEGDPAWYVRPVVNFFGPIAAAAFLTALLSFVNDQKLRFALVGNFWVQIMFALIETTWAFGDRIYDLSGKNQLVLLALNGLSKPESNILLIILVAIAAYRFHGFRFPRT
jgi:hypothetical protein